MDSKFSLLFFLSFLIIMPFAKAHSDEFTEVASTGFTSVEYIIGASLISGALILFSILYKNKSEKLKWVLFLGITIPIILATAEVVITTVTLNLESESSGPV